MNVKKEVMERVIKTLQDEYKDCNYKIMRNKSDLRRLANEQTILKREKVKLHEVINSIKTSLPAV